MIEHPRLRGLAAVTSDALRAAWGLVAPVECAGCGTCDRALCGPCVAGLHPRLRRAALDPGLPLTAGLDYDGVARRVILAVKEGDRTELAVALRPALLAAVRGAYERAVPGPTPLLVTVPGGSAGLARRGFHPAELLAGRAGLRVTRALRPVRSARTTQKRRALAERREVDAARWRVSPSVAGARVVLLDDVVTSGSTLRAAVRALRAAGAEVAGCAAVAATPRRVGESSIPWEFLSDGHARRGDKRGSGGLT